MTFLDQLQTRWKNANSLVCVGLDPEPKKFPAHLRDTPDAVYTFCKAIIDATAPHVCAYKPQIAHFAALAAEDTLKALITHIHQAHPGIPVILDSKRGDIGSTAQNYAIEAFDRYGADAVTVNPYLGGDSLAPFLERRDKGVIILCRTSNPGAADFQDLAIDNKPLYQHVAKRVAERWNTHSNCALVVGATWPAQLREVRDIVGNMPLLVPGIGAQGGDVQAVISNGQTDNGTGLMISSSRAILYASDDVNFADAAKQQAVLLRDQINLYRSSAS